MKLKVIRELETHGSGGDRKVLNHTKLFWKQLYTTLTEEYGLHNLIWEFNSYTYSSSPEWYPGDEWVDMVGFDKYNCIYNRTDGLSDCPNEDAISDTFYNLVNLTDNKKLVAMPENDTVPSLENMLIEKLIGCISASGTITARIISLPVKIRIIMIHLKKFIKVITVLH